MCWSARAQGDSGLAGGELLSAFTRCGLFGTDVQWSDWDWIGILERLSKDMHGTDNEYNM